VNHQQYTLEPLPSKVENFIKRLEQETQERIDAAFEYICESPFQHENPTTIRKLRGKKTVLPPQSTSGAKNARIISLM
jgi:hypothetical protein